MHSGFFDGSSNPNPGELGLGSVIFDCHKHEIDWAVGYEEYGTNNIAEYMSAIMLLKRALSLGIKELRCFGDSKLIINQINGVWACSAKDLKPLLHRLKTLAAQFNHVQFEWIKREENKRADELSKHGVINKAFSCKVQTTDDKPVVASNQNTLKPKVRPINVKIIRGNRLLIMEDSRTVVFHTTSLACTCGEYHLHGTCKHGRLFQASLDNQSGAQIGQAIKWTHQ